MFRPVIRIQKLRRTTVVLNRFLRRNNNEVQTVNRDAVKQTKLNLIEEWDEPSELIDSFRPKLTSFEKSKLIFDEIDSDLRNDYRIKKMDRFYNDEIVEHVSTCQNVNNLLEFIGHPTVKLLPHHIECVYDKLNTLCNELKKNDVHHFRSTFETIRSSPGYNLLLKRTLQLIRELDNRTLVNQLDFFNLIEQNADTKIVMVTLEMLKHKLNDLELDEIGRCLFVFDSNSNKKLSNFFLTFRHALLQVAKIKIMSNQFDYENFDLVTGFLRIFASVDSRSNVDVIIHLNRALLQSKVEWTCLQAVQLLDVLKSLKQMPVEQTTGIVMNEMIRKCNSVIYEKLALNATERERSYYVEKIHRLVDGNLESNANYRELYDDKIVKLISPFLIENFDKYEKLHLLNLIQNCSNFNIFDETLMERMYSEIKSNDDLRSKLNCFLTFKAFTKVRLPFVDCNELASVLFDFKNAKLNFELLYKMNSVKLLRNLVLNDVDDVQLLSQLLNLIGNLDRANYVRDFDLKKLILAKIYLEMSKQIDTGIHLSVHCKLKELIIICSRYYSKPTVGRKYLKVDGRLQKDAYHSSGLHLNGLAIYDKSKCDLVSLVEFKDYFHKVDCIPLNENQEL